MQDEQTTNPAGAALSAPRRTGLHAQIAALWKEVRDQVARLDGDIASQVARIDALEATAAAVDTITEKLTKLQTVVEAVATWQDAQVIAEAEKKEEKRQADERQAARDQRTNAILMGMVPLIFSLIALAGAALVQHANGAAGTVISGVVMVAGVGAYFVIVRRNSPPPPPPAVLSTNRSAHGVKDVP